MISLQSLVQAIIVLIVAGLIFWLLWWGLNRINPPEPFKQVGTVVLVIMSVLICIGVLMGLIGHPIITW